MSIKILHASDFHMDTPFDSLPEAKAAERRKECRGLLEKIAQIAEEEAVDLMLLSGDLLDSSVSYYETQETLARLFSRTRAEIFIAPGNHDYYCAKSPYASLHLPEHVHIFTSPVIKSFDIPSLGCRVWGAGFNAPLCPPLLKGFSAEPSDLVDIMVLHGDTGGDPYNHITESEIASSNLDYLALGHIHAFSGIKRAGNTTYAYPGCPEGRGFDETGRKGVIIGEISKSCCNLRFFPLGGREYTILKVDMTNFESTTDLVAKIIEQKAERDIVRIILTGESDLDIDTRYITERIQDSFYHVTVRNETRPRRNIWNQADDDTLKGLFLIRLREKYKTADDVEKTKIELAVRYGLMALENREELSL